MDRPGKGSVPDALSQGLLNLLTTSPFPLLGFVLLLLQGVLDALVNLAIPQDVSISSFDTRLLMIFSSGCTQSKTLFGKSYRNLIASQSNIRSSSSVC